MKRYVILFATVLCFTLSCHKIEDIIVKDDDVCSKMDDIVFMQYCYDNYDVNHDGKLAKSEAEAVRVIDMNRSQYYGLKSLKGIEYFSSLFELDCTGTSLESINVTKNTKLEIIAIGGTQVSSIDVSKCTELKELDIRRTNITKVNLSKNTKLETLYAYNLALTSIDVSKCSVLKTLNLSHTKITDLDISHNTQLENLYFGDEGLTVKVNCMKVPDGYTFYGDSVIFSCNGKILPLSCFMVWEGKVYNEKNYNGIIQYPYFDVGVGESITLDAVPDPSNAESSFLWESSDESTATVNNGVVKGISIGNVSIYAKPATGGHSAYASITIRPAVRSVKIYNELGEVVKVGDYWCLDYSLDPSDAADRGAIWSSSDENVLYTKDNVDAYGNHFLYAYAKAPGKVTLTVKTKSGGKTASCELTVVEKKVPVTSISLSSTSLSLNVGQKSKLNAIVNPSNATEKIQWSSGISSIASVDSEGNVTALSVGSTVITARSSESGKTATCKVTVSASSIPVTGITLDKTTMSLTVGSTGVLNASVLPSNATNLNVLWSSSNSSIASVSSAGVVTAKAAGTATITAKTSDGGKTATCQVTVTTTNIPVTGISLDKQTMTLSVGSTGTLKATLSPFNATGSEITWSSSNTAVATVSSSGVITAIAVGSTTITCTTLDGTKKANCTLTVTADQSSVYFPDANFRNYMISNFDLDKDGKISISEANKVTNIKVGTKRIASLSGIEYLENLKSLDVSNSDEYPYISGELTSLDLSNNKYLTTLKVDYNKIESINVAENIALTSFSCSNNQLTSLDLSNNTALTSLSCKRNQLTSLDLSENNVLTTLDCSYNKLTSLDLKNNKALTTLNCYNNKLSSVNVSNSISLTYLKCDSNQLTSLDLSNNKALCFLDCTSNQLTNLDISNNASLKQLYCSSNQLTSLDVSNVTSLYYLDCSPMPTLATLYVASGQSLINVTYNRSDKYIPDNTKIVVKSQ